MKLNTHEPLFILKPNLVNALTPSFVKYLSISFVISFLIYSVFSLLNYITDVNKYYQISLYTIALVFVVFLCIPFLLNIFILRFTSYKFYPTNVVKQFKFVTIKKRSIFYDKILEIKLDISIWDRLSKAGDIQLVSADDSSPNLVLKYIENPENVEKKIYALINKLNKPIKLRRR